MARWAAFVGLTMLVLTFFLGLARLSQSLVRDDGSPLATDGVATDRPDASSTADVDASYPAGSPASHTVDPATDPALGVGALLANVALTQGLVGAVLVGGFVYFEIPLSALGVTGEPWVGGLPALGLGVGFGVALWLGNEAAATVVDAAGATYDEKLREMLAPDSVGGWIVLLVLVLPTIAFVEELLFRASLVGVVHAGFGVSAWLMAVLSSVAFALGHGAQGRVGIAVTGVLGLVLAAGFVVTGSLLVVVVAHYLVNAMEFVVHELLGADRLLT